MTAAQRALLERMRGHYERRTADRFFDGEDEVLAEQTADALRAALGTCGTCAHINREDDQHGFCAAPMGVSGFPFLHGRMPLGERCTGYTPKSDE